jgi:hypothetical protein
MTFKPASIVFEVCFFCYSRGVDDVALHRTTMGKTVISSRASLTYLVPTTNCSPDAPRDTGSGTSEQPFFFFISICLRLALLRPQIFDYQKQTRLQHSRDMCQNPSMSSVRLCSMAWGFRDSGGSFSITSSRLMLLRLGTD